MPEATHVAKCLKGSLANWFLFKGGERFNLSNLRMLYNDPTPAIWEKMRSAVTLSAVRNRDRMSVPDLLQKKSMVARLKEWIANAQRENKLDCSKLSTLPSNCPISIPLAVCGFGIDLLFISDLHTLRILQVYITNNGAVLKGTVISEILLKQTALPYGISVATGNLFVADSSDDGGFLRINLATNRETVLVSNKPTGCQRIHGLAAAENEDIVFMDRDSCKLHLFSGSVRDIAGSGDNSCKDGSTSSCALVQPTAV